ncbi:MULTISPECIES: hypothetical protein [Natrinema]|uniref:Uncharacterized protein n=2 Tax=Natrinema TaxID=88723 RepID=M0CUA8_9EURY|nr:MULTISPECIES: hypothetical protein [Natrinema]ELZ25982.1 hypothetical protein C476_00987 [Natrinema limicola JCM 13563]RZV12345.1 hypothetical protein BDK88_1250 [Natrinema hispanicum]
MIRSVLSRLREWISVEDPEERIEGSGAAIVSPQHRRSLEAERELDRLDNVTDTDRHRER